MRYPWANSLLFPFLGLELLTGFLGLISGSEDRSIYLQLHRIGGYGIVAVLVWKTVNVAMSLKWRRSGPVRTASLVLTGLLVATLVLGFVWSWVGPYSWWLFSGVSWHIYVGDRTGPALGLALAVHEAAGPKRVFRRAAGVPPNGGVGRRRVRSLAGIRGPG